MKFLLNLTLGMTLSVSALAQPFILSCNLDFKYTRNNVIEEQGIWCRNCKISITIDKSHQSDRREILRIDGVYPEFNSWYQGKEKRLDLNGFGYDGEWKITPNFITASQINIKYHKNRYPKNLSINRYTGSFYAHSKTDNPIGDGYIEIVSSGECQASKPAF
jgi:hypothetical protein